ncbi:hypothetical protein CQW23_20872 [Capsicum baccatum]|uniref:Uncharacterized protein n=1 Tax=Capsicum baccatum TaxID=33114 RepID=A0A2G2W9W2_CAPBA|nr:hypothetical protein CQW23_20872 [Capsicum baccatum]
MALLDPYFGNGKPDGLWTYLCPKTNGIDDPRFNLAAHPKILSKLKCSKIFVFTAGKDNLRDRTWTYYETMKKIGWKGDITNGDNFHKISPWGSLFQYGCPYICCKLCAITKVETDRYLLELVKDLKHEDSIDFYAYHVLDEPIINPNGPTDFLPAPDVIEGEDLERERVGIANSANIEREFVGVEEEREADLEDFNLEDVELENINLGGDEADVEDIHVEDVNLEDICVEGGDEDDVEDVNIENRGFRNIGKNKATKYAEKLGGNEEYLDSYDCWSEDSEEIDVDAVRGVDLPRRRSNKKIRDSGDFIVKNYNPIHKCIPLNNNTMCDSKLVARKFKDKIVSQSYIRIWEIQDLVREMLGLYVGKLLVLMDAFSKELVRVSCWFTVGKNGNNQMYSIAWAVIDTETKHSRKWFIRYLNADLNLRTGEGLTVMSDQQKDLVPILMNLLPNTERRMYARHI